MPPDAALYTALARSGRLDKLVSERVLRKVTCPFDTDYALYEYTSETLFDANWSAEAQAARGLVVDAASGRVLCNPMPKFFNLNEVEATRIKNLPDEPFIALEKLDGTLILVWRDPKRNEWIYNTRGDWKNEFIEWAKELPLDKKNLDPEYTYSFELIHPKNRIVIDYGARRELVLVAVRRAGTGEEEPWARLKLIAGRLGASVPREFADFKIEDIGFEPNQEGYVLLYPGGFRVKVKSPAYVKIARVINALGPKLVIDLIRGKEYRAVSQQVPPHIRQQLDDVASVVRTRHQKLMNEAEKAMREIQSLPTPKEKALWIQNNLDPEPASVAFALWKDKDPEGTAWNLIRKNITRE